MTLLGAAKHAKKKNHPKHKPKSHHHKKFTSVKMSKTLLQHYLPPCVARRLASYASVLGVREQHEQGGRILCCDDTTGPTGNQGENYETARPLIAYTKRGLGG